MRRTAVVGALALAFGMAIGGLTVHELAPAPARAAVALPSCGTYSESPIGPRVRYNVDDIDLTSPYFKGFPLMVVQLGHGIAVNMQGDLPGKGVLSIYGPAIETFVHSHGVPAVTVGRVARQTCPFRRVAWP